MIAAHLLTKRGETQVCQTGTVSVECEVQYVCEVCPIRISLLLHTNFSGVNLSKSTSSSGAVMVSRHCPTLVKYDTWRGNSISPSFKGHSHNFDEGTNRESRST